jgi:hypothetical protein
MTTPHDVGKLLTDYINYYNRPSDKHAVQNLFTDFERHLS